MRKNILAISLLCFIAQSITAQSPKWIEKAKRAVFSVVTYDKEGKILGNGNGFFVTEDGIGLSDYALFKGAERAVIVSTDGVQMPVDAILGANSMYDVVKFRVGVAGKKVPALTLAATPSVAGADVYLLPYSTQKDRESAAGKVKTVSKIQEKYHYYTLTLTLKDKMVSCPVMNDAGQVVGIAQKSTGQDATTTCYAAGADYAFSQSISALSLSDITLRNIGIRKGLPDAEDQALIYLYMASSQVAPEEYKELLNDFIKLYPNNPEGYLRRAAASIYEVKSNTSFDNASADFGEALRVGKKKDDVYYTIAKQIYIYQLNKPENTYKDWTFDKALEHVRSALAIAPLPVYTQLEGDILFAKQDYPGALAAYEKVNLSNLASPATFFSAAKTKEVMKADLKEVIVLMDSCIARSSQPVSEVDAPYLLERARLHMEVEQYRPAMLDYDAYFTAVGGKVNDVFYYYREQSAVKGRQFQRALDDIAKAIEINPQEMMYRSELAAINLRVGRNEEAVKVLKDALTIDPKYAEAYRLMGIARIQLKQQAEACADFAKAKELGDTNVEELIKKHCGK